MRWNLESTGCVRVLVGGCTTGVWTVHSDSFVRSEPDDLPMDTEGALERYLPGVLAVVSSNASTIPLPSLALEWGKPIPWMGPSICK